MIKINNLNKYYNKGKASEIHVINDTQLELPSKGLITFLGHSGSGKTTLLNVIGGLDKATGEIQYDDVVFKKYKASKIDKFRSKSVGYVFQNYNLLLEETVYDNLRISLELIGITDKEEQKKRIEYSLKAVGMFKYRKKVASFLSGGQQQRVSIARALVKKTKIIIADEPTGNLDSKNTIEVMNILKKISEYSLVLLVTHEENVANFYSDVIYEIKDGKIINKLDVNNNVTFDNSDDSTIYLKDLKRNDYQTELGNIIVRTDSDEDLKINLDLIIKNGNIYLKSDKPIKLVEQSNLKIIDDNYKKMKREDISSFDYDTSFYNDNNKSESKKFKKFIRRITNSFKSFRSVGRKQKFLYICLAFIGVIMSISFAILSNALVFDISTSSYSNNVYSIDMTNSKANYYNILEDAYEEGEINDLYKFIDSYISYDEYIVNTYSISVRKYRQILPYLDYNVELFKGTKPIDSSDIVISKDIADAICDKTNRTYDELIGKTVISNGYNNKITGISKNDNLMAYISLSQYELWFNNINSFNWYYEREYSIGDDTIYYSNYDIRYKGFEEYEILSGRDVLEESDDFEALVSIDSSYEINEYINFGGISAKVVGIYKNYEYDDYNVLITNKNVKYKMSYPSIGFLYEDSANLKLIKGRYPKNPNEVIISAYYNYGEKDLSDESFEIMVHGKNRKVVGYFISSPDCDFPFIESQTDYMLYDYGYFDSTNSSFNVIDKEAFENRLKQNKASLTNLNENISAIQKETKKDSIKTFIYIFAVTAIASSFFVYFIMRSKMLSDIYNIGVYRSLGASKARINRKYLSDIFILTTFTALIGYIAGTLIYFSITKIVNGIIEEMAGMYGINAARVLMSNIGISFLGVLALYLIMYLFGMLPIIMLQRKTPSEIFAKYDI